jgi:TolB-like protein
MQISIRMASLIPGYEYDIFISYRQKDNKGDRWVSEFVEALKTELESTFKEEISVYFDINPHDGLLETHSVNRSLEDKLKCLIFIPIISRTYCDPKSFAWEHEFVAFNKIAKEDRFGRDIRLTSGNVASRILPVKIHDLDPEDKALLENELGGVLRCVEFIYKSAGVNRPLRANEDHPQDNLNKTYYRDQINKVANAVKEITSAVKKYNQQDGEFPKEVVKTNPEPSKKLKPKIIIASFVLLVLIVLGYFFIPIRYKSDKQLEKTIAVLPFRNLSNDTTQLYFCDGFMEEILNNLQKINSFTVRSRTSSEQYRDTKKSLTVIGNELNVNYLIEGSVGREGDNLKIWVQLIDSKADKHVWSNDYTRESKQIFSLQSEIAKNIASELKERHKIPKLIIYIYKGAFSGTKELKQGKRKALNILKNRFQKTRTLH